MIRKITIEATIESVKGTEFVDPDSGVKTPQVTVNLGERLQVQVNQDDALYGMILKKLRSGMEVVLEAAAIAPTTKEGVLQSGDTFTYETGWKKLLGVKFLSIKPAPASEVFAELPDAPTEIIFTERMSSSSKWGKKQEKVEEYTPSADTKSDGF